MQLVKTSKIDPREAYILMMWLRFLLSPEKKTLPGECVNLGEIGEVRKKDWTRATPYSLAELNESPKTL